MKNASALLLASMLLASAGCSREKPADATTTGPAQPETPIEAPAPAAVAAAPTPAAVPESPTAAFDKGAFSGTFSAGANRLELNADGSYTMEGPSGATQGSWTHEAGSNTVRLDPGSKDAQDAVLRIDGNDALVMIDAQGQPVPGQAQLRREAVR